MSAFTYLAGKFTPHMEMPSTPKEKLSALTEKIFKGYTDPGLHVCDLATGGGKSYTIAKLVCEYYPDHFDRIVILCCQNKLVDAMDREIDRFICGENSRLKPEDKLVVRNNIEVAREAASSKKHDNYLVRLADEISRVADMYRSPAPELYESSKRISDRAKTVTSLFEAFQYSNKGNEKEMEAQLQLDSESPSIIQKQISDMDKALRGELKAFFFQYKKFLEASGRKENILVSEIFNKFPSLEKAYPHVKYKEKKVLLMTGDKAFYGIDPILSDLVTLTDLAGRGRGPKSGYRTLFLFDESDQLAMIFRKAIIKREVDNNRLFRSNNIYRNFLTYASLVENSGFISGEYHRNLITNGLDHCRQSFSKMWVKSGLDGVTPYRNILPANAQEFAKCRNGVFFCGPFFRLDFGSGGKVNSYICVSSDGEKKQFEIVHCEHDAALDEKYSTVIRLDDFVRLISGCNRVALTQLARITRMSLEHARELFRAEYGNSDREKFFGYPSRDREIHTLFSRFALSNERMYERQLSDYMLTRKNQMFVSGEKSVKSPDYSVYFQGIRLYRETFDDTDSLHNVSISSWEINTTPEKMLYEILLNPGASVVLCSATASNMSVVNNFDMMELRHLFGDRMDGLAEDTRKTFDGLVRESYPQEHRIEVHPIDFYSSQKMNADKVALPEEYRCFFCRAANRSGLVDAWFAAVKEDMTKRSGSGEIELYHLSRLYQFIEAYHWFCNHNDIHSMLYFQNFNPRLSQQKESGMLTQEHFHVLACLIDGSYRTQLRPEYKDNPCAAFESGLPDWKSGRIYFTNRFEDVEERLLGAFSKNRNAKLMLITAYNSFKAGANLQYAIPDGLKCSRGDDWTPEGETPKKDWDAIYLQLPSNYLSMPQNCTGAEHDRGLLDVLLKLMMFQERGWLDRITVKRWLDQAVSGRLMFNEPYVADDKAAWVQNYVEQAIGRICRTRNKPPVTYILYDRQIEPFILEKNLQKSLTAEFRSFADNVISNSLHQQPLEGTKDVAQVKRVNDANNVEQILDRKIRSVALHYISHLAEDASQEDSGEDGDGYDTLSDVLSKQELLRNFKRTIIRKPVIDSLDELIGEDRWCTFIDKCYGDWEREADGSYKCYYTLDKNTRRRICLATKYTISSPNSKTTVSSDGTRLDVFMKNSVIRRHFEENGFATEWKSGKLILHPDILMYDYAGEIGEEAFRALVLEYTSCTEESLTHLEGRDYELADFVVLNPDGTRKVAFDVKNFAPEMYHYDKPGDIPTDKKREMKLQRLGCPLYTVNMLDQEVLSADKYEITGLIDRNGREIDSAIRRLREMIDN